MAGLLFSRFRLRSACAIIGNRSGNKIHKMASLGQAIVVYAYSVFTVVDLDWSPMTTSVCSNTGPVAF